MILRVLCNDIKHFNFDLQWTLAHCRIDFTANGFTHAWYSYKTDELLNQILSWHFPLSEENGGLYSAARLGHASDLRWLDSVLNKVIIAAHNCNKDHATWFSLFSQ